MADSTAQIKPPRLSLQGRSLGLAISAISTTGFLLFGYDQGVMSGIISAPPFVSFFPDVADSTYAGFVTAIYEVGCLIGAIFSLTHGDKLGRRKMVRPISYHCARMRRLTNIPRSS